MKSQRVLHTTLMGQEVGVGLSRSPYTGSLMSYPTLTVALRCYPILAPSESCAAFSSVNGISQLPMTDMTFSSLPSVS